MKTISAHIISDTEKWNCITHAAGVLFAILFKPGMLLDSYEAGDKQQFLNIVLYCISFFSTFLSSTIYHGLTYPQLKNRFRKIDQASIHFLIAATYGPLIFKYMNTGKGLLLMTIVTAFVPVGVAMIRHYKSKYSSLMVTIYAFQGLMYLFFFNSFFRNMPSVTEQMILGGSMIVVAGIFFFKWQKWRYSHAIWNLFVLNGNIFFFFAIESSINNI
ncbi:MAG TPA: hemolysin III family protein [Hanamia sp.]|nr:hemolysin III family protein [Hanamia sp.]